MSIKDEITSCLQKNFNISTLEVINESAHHAGHAGDDGSGESHFRIRIRAKEFADMGRIARHRAIHTSLGDIMTKIHALALEVEG